MGLRWIVYPLFFASGAAGLIYEVVWTRMLLVVFGAGLYAVCAVLAAFMAGLALGSWLLGRVSDRLSHPLRTYGLLELGIALSGILLPLLIHLVELADGWAYAVFGQQFGPLTAVRFICAFGLLTLPTTLMGATLPVMTRFLVRTQSHLGLHVGGLYATNTFGAVCGAFLAGFVLIANFGLLGSEWIAAGLNLLAGAGALGLSLLLEGRRPVANAGGPPAAQPKSTPPPTPAAPKRVVVWVLTTALISGAVALGAQVLWSRSLVFGFEYLKNTTYAFSAMLTVFLAGLAIGAALIGPFVDRQREPLRLYGVLLTLIGIAILLSVTMLYSGASLFTWAQPYDEESGTLNWALAVVNVMLQTLGTLGIPTVLMGMAFPLAARLVAGVGRVGGDVGRLYAFNTIGAIIGSLLAGFVIVPMFGLTVGLILLGLINVVIGLVTISQTPDSRPMMIVLGTLGAIMVVAVFYGLPRGQGLQPLSSLERMEFYEEGRVATVAVVENNLRHRTIMIDGVGVAGTDPILQTDQKSLAHMPMMLLENPKKALTVGFGSGGASYSLLLHDRLEQVDCVEICPTVIKAAPYLTLANHGFLENDDDRYRIIFDDARAYLRNTDQSYDIIATDCTDLRYKSNANLYDLEYFQACRERLTPRGIVVVWMPLAGLSKEVFRIALRTFHRVFPAMAVFYMSNEQTHYILLIGWQDRVSLDYGRFVRTLQEPDVRSDLTELSLDDPIKLLSCFVTAGADLDAYLAGDALNTENNPLIEFLSPKYGYFDRPLIDNLDELMSIYTSPRQYMAEGSLPPEEAERLSRYEQALPHIIQGHASYRGLDIEGAARAYIEALRLTPEDVSLKERLRFPVLQKRLASERNNPFVYLSLGRVYMLQETPDKLSMAYDLLGRAEELLRRNIQREPDEITRRQLEQALRWRRLVRRQLDRPTQ